MAIHEMKNGIRVVTLGEGTTNLSLVYVEDSPYASGILMAPLEFTGEYTGKEVVMQITNAAGIASLMRQVMGLVGTWTITGDDSQAIETAKMELEALHKRLSNMG